jgi:homoserine O-succinyltransferase
MVRHARSFGDCAEALRIGLINNMPDAALKATERQFKSLLDSAAGETRVQLSLYTLPEIPRTKAVQRHIDSTYSSVTGLLDGTLANSLDGLIVTGREPLAANLREERYWDSLAKLVEWAELHTRSAIWSCLAAHAAVLHLDGIERRRLSQKHFGVFECLLAEDNFLTEGLPPSFPVPHSRWNDVAECDLAEHGYRVLSRDRDGKVDAFFKCRKSAFLFFQGHPEYETGTLLREYRRDVKQQNGAPPALPAGYAGNRNTWRSAASQIYRNWIAWLCAGKATRAQ